MHDLSIERGEIIVINGDIEVSLVDILADRVRLGINAPREVTIHRREVYDAIKQGNHEAARVKAPGQPGPDTAKPTVDSDRAR